MKSSKTFKISTINIGEQEPATTGILMYTTKNLNGKNLNTQPPTEKFSPASKVTPFEFLPCGKNMTFSSAYIWTFRFTVWIIFWNIRHFQKKFCEDIGRRLARFHRCFHSTYQLHPAPLGFAAFSQKSRDRVQSFPLQN